MTTSAVVRSARDPAEMQALLGAIPSPKIRAVSTVICGAGLRVSEACALQSRDIDGQRGVLHVLMKHYGRPPHPADPGR